MSSSIRLSLLLSSVILFFGCSTKTEQNEDSSSLYDSTAAVPLDVEDIGVTGDFDGDGTVENVAIRVLNDSNFNSEEPFSYAFEFSNPKMTLQLARVCNACYFWTLTEVHLRIFKKSDFDTADLHNGNFQGGLHKFLHRII